MEERHHSDQFYTVNTHHNVEIAEKLSSKEHLDHSVFKVNSNLHPGMFLDHPRNASHMLASSRWDWD